jgi:hypothetical protein
VEEVHHLDRLALPQQVVIHPLRLVVQLDLDRQHLGELDERQHRSGGRFDRHRLASGRLEGEEFLQKVECVLVDVKTERGDLGAHSDLRRFKRTTIRTCPSLRAHIQQFHPDHLTRSITVHGRILVAHLGEERLPRRGADVVDDLEAARGDGDARGNVARL